LYAAKSAGRNRVVSYDSISVSQPNSLVVEPVIEAVPKTTLADVVDFGEDLPDPSQLIAQVEVKALGEDDSALKALMQSIDSAYETAKKEEIAQAEISVAGGGMKNESGA
jgi:hypothetical protein